jgi:hypothetical protein
VVALSTTNLLCPFFADSLIFKHSGALMDPTQLLFRQWHHHRYVLLAYNIIIQFAGSVIFVFIFFSQP